MRARVAPLDPRREPGAKPGVVVLTSILALGVFLLTYCSPIDSSKWDAGLALLGSQALLEHGTLNLDVYRADPRLEYDLEQRSSPSRGGHYHSYLGVQVVSVPAVWVANRLGMNMLDRGAETEVQNALSALAVTLVFVLLFVLCRCYVSPGVSLAIASVSTFGSMVVSTLGTALWDIDYEMVTVCVFLIWTARRGDRPFDLSAAALGGSLLAVAYLMRPSAGLLGLAFLLILLGAGTARVRFAGAMALGAGVLFAAWMQFSGSRYIPGRYSPLKLFLGGGDPLAALPGLLLSPSRGLFIFCPFLIVTAAVVIFRFRGAIRSAAPRLVLLWAALLLLAVCFKQHWWGGGGFGPRLLTELMPGLTLLTAWGWAQLAALAAPARRSIAVCYLVLGAFAVFVHSYQGLWNQATQDWGVDVERRPALVFDWRWPQFLATPDALEDRRVARERPQQLPLHAGRAARFDGSRLLFLRGWYPPDAGFGRWTRGTESELAFAFAGLDRQASYLLDLHVRALVPQTVAVALQGAPLAVVTFPESQHRHALVPVPAGLLQDGENRLRLRVPGARSIAPDPRPLLGIAVQTIRLVQLAAEPSLAFTDDAFFDSGFHVAEPAGRWTEGERAQLTLPVGTLLPQAYELDIETGAFEQQRVEVVVNGASIGHAALEGQAPRTLRFAVPPGVLRENRLNDVALLIAAPRRPPGQDRRLGLLVRTVRLRPSASPEVPR